MSFETKLKVLYDRFEAQFSASDPNVEILWDNVKDDTAPNAREPWVRVKVNWGDTRGASIPASRWRTAGVFQVQIFVPKGTGITAAMALGDAVSAAMQGITVSEIRLRATSLRPVGVDDGWYQLNANTPFVFDEST